MKNALIHSLYCALAVLLVEVVFSTPKADAQATARGGAASCGTRDSCAAISYVATTTDGGPAYTATGAGTFAKGPGDDARIDFTDTGEVHICRSGSTTCTLQLGASHRFVGGEQHNLNGLISCDNNCYFGNIYKQVNFHGANGMFMSLVTTLPTCNAALDTGPSNEPGVTTFFYRSSGAADRLCSCLRQSDGTSYAWVSAAGTGSSTSCP